MRYVTLDFETRSFLDLKKTGAFRYAEDSSTQIILLSLWTPDGKMQSWIGPIREFRILPGKLFVEEKINFLSDADLKELFDNLTSDSTVRWVAHNALFEIPIWRKKLTPYLGVPCPAPDLWIDTAVLAAQNNLPRDLARAAIEAGLPLGKDVGSKRSAMALSKPNAKKQWVVKPELFHTALHYNRRDVEVTWLLFERFQKWIPFEAELKKVDRRINLRGMPIDTGYLKRMVERAREYEEDLAKEFKALSGLNHTQRQKILDWIWRTFTLYIPNMQGETLTVLLEKGLEGWLEGVHPSHHDAARKVYRALEIYLTLSRTSVKKLKGLLGRVSLDHRLRGALAPYAALTGRWGGRGFQPQNLPRPGWDFLETQKRVQIILDEGTAGYAKAYPGEDPMLAIRAGIRGVVAAGEGKILIAGDYSQIEARVLPWLAGDQATLDIFASGRKIYEATAAKLFSLDEKMVTKDQRFLGKTAVLALGYGGGLNAFRRLGGKGEQLPSDEEIVKIIKRWRETHPEIVEYWSWAEKAARAALKIPKKPFKVGPIRLWYVPEDLSSLFVQLPSGRVIRYPKFRLELDRDRNRWVLSYFGRRQDTGWGRVYTYGGKLVENWTQAVARDLLAGALLRAESSGGHVVEHVHDEIVLEEMESKREKMEKKLVKWMTTRPSWAKDLPLEVKTWTGKRYRKD